MYTLALFSTTLSSITSVSLPKDIHGFGVEGPFLTTIGSSSTASASSSEVNGVPANLG